MGKVTELRIESGLVFRPDAGDCREGDLAAIRATARFVTDRARSTGSFEVWNSIGWRLATLKEKLAKNHGGRRRGVSEADARIGWNKAFEVEKWPLSRRDADKLVDIHGFFQEGTRALLKPHDLTHLPVSRRSLYVIATRFKDHKEVFAHLAAGHAFNPFMTEREVRALADEHLPSPERSLAKAADEPEPTAKPAAKRAAEQRRKNSTPLTEALAVAASAIREAGLSAEQKAEKIRTLIDEIDLRAEVIVHA